jgi:hypothetical protein
MKSVKRAGHVWLAEEDRIASLSALFPSRLLACLARKAPGLKPLLLQGFFMGMNAPAPSGRTNNGRSRFPWGTTDKKSKNKGRNKSRSFDSAALRSG